jgi:hypothetical protein
MRVLWHAVVGSSFRHFAFQVKFLHGNLPVIFFLLLLLLWGDIELIPGPTVNHPLSSERFGCIIISPAVNKATSIHDTVVDFRLDFLALSETRIIPDKSNTVKNDIAPPTCAVLHAHRLPTAIHPQVSDLAVIQKDTIIVKPHQLDFSFNPETFDVQVVRIVTLRPLNTIVNFDIRR